MSRCCLAPSGDCLLFPVQGSGVGNAGASQPGRLPGKHGRFSAWPPTSRKLLWLLSLASARTSRNASLWTVEPTLSSSSSSTTEKTGTIAGRKLRSPPLTALLSLAPPLALATGARQASSLRRHRQRRPMLALPSLAAPLALSTGARLASSFRRHKHRRPMLVLLSLAPQQALASGACLPSSLGRSNL